MNRRTLTPGQISTLLIFLLALVYLAWLGYGVLPKPAPPTPTPIPPLIFTGERALALAQQQCDFGPRPTGSPAGWRTGDWIISQLQAAGWEVETHEFLWNNTPVRNIIGRGGPATIEPAATPDPAAPPPALMLAAHYDTRLIADRDPNPLFRTLPVLGGNDGASGVAVLLELARVLDPETLPHPLWLTFVDAEDNGNIPDWEWAIGSTRLAEELDPLPAAMILIDMVGDNNQRIPFEANSDLILSQQLWTLAAELGFGEVFLPEIGPALTDDHIPFLRQGVPAVDIIDFDYPEWHTTGDTCDKLDPASLERVGRLLQVFVESNGFGVFLGNG